MEAAHAYTTCKENTLEKKLLCNEDPKGNEQTTQGKYKSELMECFSLFLSLIIEIIGTNL